jgi:hypothetical protein
MVIVWDKRILCRVYTEIAQETDKFRDLLDHSRINTIDRVTADIVFYPIELFLHPLFTPFIFIYSILASKAINAIYPILSLKFESLPKAKHIIISDINANK